MLKLGGDNMATETQDIFNKIKSDIEQNKQVENIPYDAEMYDYIRGLNKALEIINFYLEK